MVKLRSLRAADYANMKLLFDDEEAVYQWPWYPFFTEKSVEKEKFVPDDFETENYTLEKFKNDMESNQIHVIEKSEKMLGYFRVERYVKDYRITEWGMFDPHNEEDNRNAMYALQRKYKKLSIVTLFHQETFRKYGFSNTLECFLHWEK